MFVNIRLRNDMIQSINIEGIHKQILFSYKLCDFKNDINIDNIVLHILNAWVVSVTIGQHIKCGDEMFMKTKLPNVEFEAKVLIIP